MKMSLAIIAGGALFVFLAVVMVVVFIPGWVWNPPQTIVAHPYTTQEARGQQLYYSNGCNYCHTQYVRYYDVNSTGPISQGGNYTFDKPLVLGSERTGPDLSYIGRKRDEQWEIEHLKYPRQLSPMSLMPDFYWMPEEDLQALGSYLFNLGDRMSAEWMIQPPVDYTNLHDPIEYPQITPTPADQGWPAWTAAGLQKGKEIYIGYCQTCHGCSGNGLGTYAGTKIVTPANYKVEPFKSMTDSEWFWHVSEGIQGTVMPPWKESLSAEDRWLAIRYIQDTFANPIERDPAEGDPTGIYANVKNPLPQTVDTLEQGKHIFIRECWVCHGDAGKGNGIYRAGLLPQPPNFSDKSHYGTIQNPLFSDADYYWRISEGLPWSAMPVWKLRYSEEDRWALVYYLRVNFTQTLPRPAPKGSQNYPPVFLAQTQPQDLTANEAVVGNASQINYGAPDEMYGRMMFTKMCAHCHGFTGEGTGWDGQYLDVKPANFTAADARGLSDGDWFSRVSYGLQDFAMPSWGEWMPLQNRWNVIEYIKKNFTSTNAQQPPQTLASVQTNQSAVPANFLTLSQANWLDEGHTIDPKQGETLYNQYCAQCHGDQGKGLSANQMTNGLNYPAAMPQNMTESYAYWRMAEGVPNTLMPPFKVLLDNTDFWNLMGYLEQIGLVQKPQD